MGQRQEWTYQDYSFPTIGTLTVDLTTLVASAEGLTPPAFTVIPEIEIVSVNAKNFVSISSKSISQVVFEHGSVGDLPPFTFTWRIVSNEASLDPASFYGSVSEAASLAGVSAGALTSAMQASINNRIDANIAHRRKFEQATRDEFYDIETAKQKELVLINSPAISVTTLTDNAQSTELKVIPTTDYVVENRTGIIKLLQTPLQTTIPLSISDFRNVFTKGFHAVRVQYVSGYALVPDIIQSLATLMLAKWGAVKATQSTLDGLKQVKAGDYTETYDITGLQVRTEYDSDIKQLTKNAKAIFNKGV